MGSAGIEPWAKAVRVQDNGKTFYLTLEHTKPIDQATATDELKPTYEITVLDAEQARAWYGSLTNQEIHEAVLQEHLADLRPLEVDRGLANCLDDEALSFEWTGMGSYELHIQAMYMRAALAPVPLRLPPQGVMQPQHGQCFNKLNSRVLNLLLQQNTQLQAQTSLQATQLQTLITHMQQVHSSYSDAVASIAASLVCEHAHLSPRTMQQTTAETAAASHGHAGKRQRLGEAAAAAPTVVPAQQPSIAASAAATIYSPAIDAVQLQQHNRAAAQVCPPNVTSPLPFGDSQLSQRPAAAATDGCVITSLPGSNRHLDRTPAKGKGRQLSSEEKLKQRILNAQRKLQQDWEGLLQQLLQAQDVAQAAGGVGSSRPVQLQLQQVVQQTDLRNAWPQETQLQPKALQELDLAPGHVISNISTESGLANAAAGQQVQQPASGAMLGSEQHALQQSALGDTAPVDDDDVLEPEPIVVVHKARGRARVVGGALAGLRKR